MIKVKFYGSLKKYMGSADSEGYMIVDNMSLQSEQLTVEDVLSKTGIRNVNIRFGVLVNGQNKQTDCVLKEGDVLIVYPLLAGG